MHENKVYHCLCNHPALMVCLLAFSAILFSNTGLALLRYPIAVGRTISLYSTIEVTTPAVLKMSSLYNAQLVVSLKLHRILQISQVSLTTHC